MHDEIYAFTRTLEGERLLVILNFFGSRPIFSLPSSLEYSTAELLISNYPVETDRDIRKLALRPYEACVYRLR